MIDARVLAVVEDANDAISHHKTKFVVEEECIGTRISYAGESLVWIGNENPKLIHIVIHREDIRTELGMLFGEVIMVTKPVIHLIVDRVLHTNVVYRLLYNQLLKDKENEDDKK